MNEMNIKVCRVELYNYDTRKNTTVITDEESIKRIVNDYLIEKHRCVLTSEGTLKPLFYEPNNVLVPAKIVVPVDPNFSSFYNEANKFSSKKTEYTNYTEATGPADFWTFTKFPNMIYAGFYLDVRDVAHVEQIINPCRNYTTYVADGVEYSIKYVYVCEPKFDVKKDKYFYEIRYDIVGESAVPLGCHMFGNIDLNDGKEKPVDAINLEDFGFTSKDSSNRYYYISRGTLRLRNIVVTANDKDVGSTKLDVEGIELQLRNSGKAYLSLRVGKHASFSITNVSTIYIHNIYARKCLILEVKTDVAECEDLFDKMLLFRVTKMEMVSRT